MWIAFLTLTAHSLAAAVIEGQVGSTWLTWLSPSCSAAAPAQALRSPVMRNSRLGRTKQESSDRLSTPKPGLLHRTSNTTSSHPSQCVLAMKHGRAERSGEAASFRKGHCCRKRHVALGEPSQQCCARVHVQTFQLSMTELECLVSASNASLAQSNG